jgi:hypothetical protein
MAKKAVEYVTYNLPKKVFIMKSTKENVLKVWPVPYKFKIDYKKIKEL